jgi:hypothetical protein
MIKGFTLGFFTILYINLCTFAQGNQDCGTIQKPDWDHILKIKNLQHNLSQRGGQLIIVPYQIHLFKASDGSSNLSLLEIYAEIDSVNDFYANAGLIFMECVAPEIVNNDYYYEFDYTLHNTDVLNQYYTPNVVNMYFANTVTSSSGAAVCGYSQFPPSEDYVVMAANCATNGSTLAHELGHLFGLPHTHGGSADELVDGSNCATEGDYICDTPADPTLSNSVVNTSCIYTGTTTDANGMPYVPDPNNIMSYSRKNCRNYFSPMQYDVINYTYLNYRNYLLCNLPTNTSLLAKKNEIVLFPNPGQNIINLYVSDIKFDSEICFYDAHGRLVFEQKCNSASIAINTSSWRNGIYFYRVINKNNDMYLGKWVKN